MNLRRDIQGQWARRREIRLRAWGGLAILIVVAVLLLAPRPVGAGSVDALVRVIPNHSKGAGWLEHYRYNWSLSEWLANVMLFSGSALALVSVWRRPLVSVVACSFVSAMCELCQIWIPSRHASVADVVANVLGALLGVSLWWGVRRHLVRRGAAKR